MMKYVFLLLLFATSAFAQQSTLHGTVAVFNSQFETGTRQYVANAQVEEAYGKSQATVTAADGSFGLPLVGIKDKEKVFFSVKKNGFEVVNVDALQTVAGQMEPQRVFMAPEGKITENKLQYYRINRMAAEKALTEKLKRLEIEIAAAQINPSRLKQLQEEYSLLQEQYEAIEKMTRELAERYAKINLDDVSKDYQNAFRCFQRGQLDSALLIFNALNLESESSVIISEQNRNAELAAEYTRRNSEKNKRKEETMESLLFKADLHQTLFEFDKAKKTYQLLIYLDSTDVPVLWIFGNFLLKQNEVEPAIYFLQKSLELVRDEVVKAAICTDLGAAFAFLKNRTESERMYLLSLKIYERFKQEGSEFTFANQAKTFNNLGEYYRVNQKTYESKKMLLNALEIGKKLSQIDPAQFEPDLARYLGNLGVLYQQIRDPDAEKMFLQSLDIYEHLAKSDFLQGEPDMARTLKNLGEYYRVVQRIPESEKMLLRSFNIYERLAKNNPNQFEPDLASACMNLGLLYQSVRNIPESEKMYLRSIKIRDRLAKQNPAQFEPELALNLMNLGGFYLTIQKMSEAEKMFLRALGIYEVLVERNADAYEPFLAMNYGNLGTYYLKVFRMTEAEKMDLRALEIYERLAKNDHTQFDPNLARAEMNLGITYDVVNKTIEAEKIYAKALRIYKQLAKKSPFEYEPDLANICMNFANFYRSIRKMPEAEELYLVSLDIYERLAKRDPKQFEPDLAFLLNNFGEYRTIKHQFKQSHIYLYRALKIWEKLLLEGKDYMADNIFLVLDNIDDLKDSLISINNYQEIALIQQEIAYCMESLIPINNLMFTEASTAYGSLSWYCLLIRDYPASESAARRALALDATQSWVNTNLAIALLFENKYKEAEKIYQNLKDQVYDQESSKEFRDVFINDLDELESAGISHPDIPKIRRLLQQK